ncbi:MAG: glycosyltransferase [Gammaproteobacteria bacterium]|nr:glycosyltransferase [Gammaproteobacteria bacterium]
MAAKCRFCSDPDVSAIIATYHDDAALDRLLGCLGALRPRPREILVVDGAASETCRRLCETQGARWLAGEPCRGKQLLQGADAARGRALWFLHADALPSADAVAAIQAAIKAGAIGGYFRFAFQGPDAPWKRRLEPWINWRAEVGTPYGDQGIFVSRFAYGMEEGHEPVPLFEEVRLVRRLRRTRMFRALQTPLAVDPRRWERDGWLRRTLMNRLLATAYGLGCSAERLAHWYSRAKRSIARDSG